MHDLMHHAATPYAPLIGLAPLMRVAFLQQDLAPLGEALLARAQAHPDDAHAYLDFSTVLQLKGQRELALAVQAQAIELQQWYSLPAQAPESGPGMRVLVVMGPGDLMSNTPIEFLVEQSDVALDLLYLTADGPFPEEVPEHDVLLVAVAESDANQPLLARLVPFLLDWPRPVVNRPEQIVHTSRDGLCNRLQDVPGVAMPRTARLSRAQLQALATGELQVDALLPGDDFPLIVRPLGSHAGHDLERMASAGELHAYLEKVGAERFYIARFVDYRNDDGQYRKYRIALIDGRPYICHFAVSSHWMIHYLNAGMDESAVKREEEARIMAHFDEQFARRHAQAFAAIDARMLMPYLGIDCAETRDGELLVFEADNAMIVHAMDAEEMYPYKRPAMQKVFAAFRAMLARAASGA
ncbi:RimK family alpha-L-glutamate ligase [Janthinobacterium sp.]|uniref:ATP-grasp domain-containing protein n=1 Tax=Janthinobacterium sp. TaxID=1871054 RepID=UPI00289FF3E2|nr:RimK family alpha-L-glutamate ligase [Janthinobacterium sp.]